MRDAAALKGQSTDDNKAGTAADAYYDSHFAKLDKIKEKQKEINDLTATYEQMWEHTGSDNARLKGVQRIVNADGSATFSGGNFASDLAGIDAEFKPKKGPKDPGISALSTFQGQVDSLDASSYTSSDNSAAAKYTSAMVKLNDELQTAIKKHADITQATAAYDKGVNTLQGDLAAAAAK